MYMKVVAECSLYEIVVQWHVLSLWHLFFAVALSDVIALAVATESSSLQLVLKEEEATLAVVEMLVVFDTKHFGECHV